MDLMHISCKAWGLIYIKHLIFSLQCKRDDDEFNKRMNFDEYLVPYNWNTQWIEKKIDEMVSLMNNDKIPEPNISCKICAYSEQYAKIVCNPIKVNEVEIQGDLFK